LLFSTTQQKLWKKKQKYTPIDISEMVFVLGKLESNITFREYRGFYKKSARLQLQLKQSKELFPTGSIPNKRIWCLHDKLPQNNQIKSSLSSR
jgi:hypothetical protein